MAFLWRRDERLKRCGEGPAIPSLRRRLPRSYKGPMEVDGPFLERLAAAGRGGAERLSSEVGAVSSNRLGRDLGRRLLERTGGWANVRFLTLLDLARELSSGGLPGTPLGNAGKVALAREALRRGQEREPGFAFAPIALRAGFPAALAALFDDFLDAGLEELPPPGRAPLEPRRWAAIASLYRDWLALPGSRAVHPAQAIVRGAAGGPRYPGPPGAARLWLSRFFEAPPPPPPPHPPGGRPRDPGNPPPPVPPRAPG